jgi:hypothetical protein
VSYLPRGHLSRVTHCWLVVSLTYPDLQKQPMLQAKPQISGSGTLQVPGHAEPHERNSSFSSQTGFVSVNDTDLNTLRVYTYKSFRSIIPSYRVIKKHIHTNITPVFCWGRHRLLPSTSYNTYPHHLLLLLPSNFEFHIPGLTFL